MATITLKGKTGVVKVDDLFVITWDNTGTVPICSIWMNPEKDEISQEAGEELMTYIDILARDKYIVLLQNIVSTDVPWGVESLKLYYKDDDESLRDLLKKSLKVPFILLIYIHLYVQAETSQQAEDKRLDSFPYTREKDRVTGIFVPDIYGEVTQEKETEQGKVMGMKVMLNSNDQLVLYAGTKVPKFAAAYIGVDDDTINDASYVQVQTGGHLFKHVIFGEDVEPKTTSISNIRTVLHKSEQVKITTQKESDTCSCPEQKWELWNGETWDKHKKLYASLFGNQNTYTFSKARIFSQDKQQYSLGCGIRSSKVGLYIGSEKQANGRHKVFHQKETIDDSSASATHLTIGNGTNFHGTAQDVTALKQSISEFYKTVGLVGLSQDGSITKTTEDDAPLLAYRTNIHDNVQKQLMTKEEWKLSKKAFNTLYGGDEATFSTFSLYNTETEAQTAEARSESDSEVKNTALGCAVLDDEVYLYVGPTIEAETDTVKVRRIHKELDSSTRMFGNLNTIDVIEIIQSGEKLYGQLHEVDRFRQSIENYFKGEPKIKAKLSGGGLRERKRQILAAEAQQGARNLTARREFNALLRGRH